VFAAPGDSPRQSLRGHPGERRASSADVVRLASQCARCVIYVCRTDAFNRSLPSGLKSLSFAHATISKEWDLLAFLPASITSLDFSFTRLSYVRSAKTHTITTYRASNEM
jgi:hypothetical protein